MLRPTKHGKGHGSTVQDRVILQDMITKVTNKLLVEALIGGAWGQKELPTQRRVERHGVLVLVSLR